MDFFVDESGDTTFYNKNGEWNVERGASEILLMGFIKSDNPELLRKKLNELNLEILKDEYLKEIPSMKKTKTAFHAKDDCPEVRYKVFKLLKDLPFECNIIFVKKTKELYEKYNGDTQKLYDSLITSLFKNKLNLSIENNICISTRGNKKRQKPLEKAVYDSFETTAEEKQEVVVQSLSGEPCLQIIDYCNWAIQRKIVCNESRYFEFLKEKFTFIDEMKY